MSTRDMLLDVMNDIDPAFIKEHMARASTTPVQRILRYAMPAAIYAAACVAVLLVIPHIIGTTPDEPPTVEPNDPIAVETIMTGETEETTESVTVTETAAETEITTAEPEVTEEITVAPPTEYVPEEPVRTEPPVTETTTTTGTTAIQYLPKNYNKYDVRRITVEKSGSKWVAGCTYNEYYNDITPMCDITFWEIINTGASVYRNRYDYTVDTYTGEITSEKKKDHDETFKSNGTGAYKTNGQFYYGLYDFYSLYNPYSICDAVKKPNPVKIENITELQELIGEIESVNIKYINDENSDGAKFIKSLQIFDEEFFESNTLFFNFTVLSSGSISYYLNDISIDDSGVLTLDFTEYHPWVMDCMMDGHICAFSFDKEFLKGVKDVKVNNTVVYGKNPEDITPTEKSQEPEGMIHFSNAKVPYSYVAYKGSPQLLIKNETLMALTEENPVFTTAEDFEKYADAWRSSEFSNYQNPVDKEVINDLDYFDESFFKTHNLYINCMLLNSSSYSIMIDNLSINDKGTLCVDFNKYKPSMYNNAGYMVLYFIVVEKDLIKTADAIYSYSLYTEVYDPETGKGEFVLSKEE